MKRKLELYVFNCKQKQRKESESELERLEKEKSEGKEEIEKLIENSDNSNSNDNPNNAIHREKNNILSYFQQNNIQSITLSNHKLIIKYNHKEEEPNTSELQAVKDYLQKSKDKTLTRKELEQKSKQNNI